MWEDLIYVCCVMRLNTVHPTYIGVFTRLGRKIDDPISEYTYGAE